MPNVPWTTLLNHFPTVLRAVDSLMETSRRNAAARDTAPALEALHHRVTALEDEQRAAAAVLKQLAEDASGLAQQVNTLTVASDAATATLRRLLLVANIAAVLALAACIGVILLWARG
jgi:hypothetical protein